MSAEYKVGYSPPKVGVYQWGSPSLTHRPWWARVEFPDSYRSMLLEVDRPENLQGKYMGYVTFHDLYGGYFRATTDACLTPEESILATEDLANKVLKAQDLPAWAEDALASGWHPPRMSNLSPVHSERPARLNLGLLKGLLRKR